MKKPVHGALREDAVQHFAPPVAMRRIILASSKAYTTRVVMKVFGVSKATAKRDMAAVRKFRKQRR